MLYYRWKVHHPTVYNLNHRLKKYRGRKLVELASKIGPILFVNEVKKTAGICRACDFDSVMASQQSRKAWEPLAQVKVRPTFSFRKKEETPASKMHVVVSRNEINAMFNDLIFKFTGYRKDQVDPKSFEKAGRILVAPNNLLFVPFATDDLSDADGLHQLTFYGSTPPFSQIREYLLQR